MICQRNCPVNCIEIETIKVSKDDPEYLKPNGEKRALWVSKFNIDFAKCMFCNLCTEECPTNAIYMTKEFEYSAYDRKNLYYKFSVMTPAQIESKKRIIEEEKAKKAAAAKAAEAKSTETKNE
jgi:NADH-quinone oxidoreductase subunit I